MIVVIGSPAGLTYEKSLCRHQTNMAEVTEIYTMIGEKINQIKKIERRKIDRRISAN